MFLLSFFTAFSSESIKIKTNFDILDSLSNVAIKTIYKNYSKQDTIFYKIIQNKSDWFIEKKLLELKGNHTLINLNNTTNKKITSKKSTIKIAIEQFDTKFNQIETSRDSLLRNCTLALNIIKNSSNEASENFDIRLSKKDTINFDDITRINTSSFEFATTSAPPKKHSFFKRILEPALLVTTVAITTILFFTVRSK